jgi:hypothetical protein
MRAATAAGVGLLALAVGMASGCAHPGRAGKGWTPCARRPPGADLMLATVSFLEGSQRLTTSTGNDAVARRAALLLEQVRAHGRITTAHLQELRVIAAEMQTIAGDRERLDRTALGEITESTVQVGVATYFAKRAVDAAERAASGTLRRIVNLGRVNDAALFSSLAPASLRSMDAVRRSLFGYLETKGVDPLPRVREALAEVGKA